MLWLGYLRLFPEGGLRCRPAWCWRGAAAGRPVSLQWVDLCPCRGGDPCPHRGLTHLTMVGRPMSQQQGDLCPRRGLTRVPAVGRPMSLKRVDPCPCSRETHVPVAGAPMSPRRVDRVPTAGPACPGSAAAPHAHSPLSLAGWQACAIDTLRFSHSFSCLWNLNLNLNRVIASFIVPLPWHSVRKILALQPSLASLQWNIEFIAMLWNSLKRKGRVLFKRNNAE